MLMTRPGHEASANPGRRYTMEECAAAAATVLDVLGINEPVDWVGNAWAATSALSSPPPRPHGAGRW
jgi:hypothetical protein